MAASEAGALLSASRASLSDRYQQVRLLTLELIRHLKPEDCTVQSMPDVSPTKWHLAHVTWFFEHFVLEPYLADYKSFNERFAFLFNSYYDSVGERQPRPKRGLLTRPTFQEVLDYRAHVDDAVQALLDAGPRDGDIEERFILGLNHEQQHQELILTDIKHVFSCNPLQPAVNPTLLSPPARGATELSFIPGIAGTREIGARDEGFCFDNETPRHKELLEDYSIGSRLVTNGEYLMFMRAGGYSHPGLWLADGWATIKERGWDRPLYWSEDHTGEFTLGGLRELDFNAPVTHVSYYEADAFARWAGARLPTEAEWEAAAPSEVIDGNLLDGSYWHPIAQEGESMQFFGDVWEWTASAYAPYPGFEPLAGSLGEYNGKFMCNQMTVRGGSCVTSADHIRPSYRSFFYPDARWQFLGIRLAKNGQG